MIQQFCWMMQRVSWTVYQSIFRLNLKCIRRKHIIGGPILADVIMDNLRLTQIKLS